MSTPTAKYDFDQDFQTKVAALCLRDLGFMRRTDGLIKPEYFSNEAVGFVLDIALKFYENYSEVPDPVVMQSLIAKEFKANKRVETELRDPVVDVMLDIAAADISGAEFVAEEITPFAQHQELSAAILESVDVIEEALDTRDSEKFQEVRMKIEKAAQVGLNDDLAGVDYFVDAEKRTEVREAKKAGTIKPTGVTTGFPRLNSFMYHKGWGRKELTLLMGGPKVGKSTALAEFAKSAVLDGLNVLVVTLEVSALIYADRLDANMSDTDMFDLEDTARTVQARVEKVGTKAGMLKIHEYPTGSMTPSALSRLISRYKSQGTKFDLVVLDYADLMRPNAMSKEAIENSKSIYIDLRAIAQSENVALLTATQLNREGAKALVASGEHVAEDYNRIRIADLVISINKTDDEKANGVARLSFAASRNQADGFIVTIKQDMDKMRFIHEIVEIK